MFLWNFDIFINKRAMLQQKFTVQVTTLPDCDDITRFDGSFVRIASGGLYGCDWCYVGLGWVRTVEAECQAYLMGSMRWDPRGAKLWLKIIPTLIKKIHPECKIDYFVSLYSCLTNFMFFTLCDVDVLKLLRFETLTFWNYYTLTLLRLETITFIDATLCDVNVVWCYIWLHHVT